MSENTSSALPDIRKVIVLNAPIDKVWAAVATSEGITAWFMPNTFQPLEGYQFTLDAGPYGIVPCQVTDLNPPHLLRFNWGKDWQLSFELKELGVKTELTLTHSGWDANTVTEFGQPHAAIRERMDQGWEKLQYAVRDYVEA
ncbi:SRPBCC domain-containing protein [Alicyclobacillus fastidiosus]|uniref:SRPBCC domain-containing protein n=1 Tax=Alicyclobacillus fastidiosus TaxID=392011 RepID=A0ABY6ZD00_9BACL|nr:SRPBCC domain-containing protein [Alicyclobacillus fastidiosus]WAH40778.1 SRPBCC domain-containing protein [Alicyclobacillus fastidiosus]GMA62253.1 hypothetical protein GCM10025859_26930 [Alicyclobacillus fastidiosus]